MALVKWDPFREIEDMFDRYTNAVGWPRQKGREITAGDEWEPRVDIAETDKAFTLKVEIPEVKKEDVTVTLGNGILTLRGERKREKEEKDKKYHKIERYFGSFARSFSLPDNIDEAKIEAVFKDGMLNLQLPKTKESKNRVITVQ